MNRREFLNRSGAASACVLGLAALPKESFAADQITVASPQGFLAEYSYLFNAYSGGHFKRQGLDAKVIGVNGIQAIQQLVSGQVQFIGTTAISLISAVAKNNAPLVSIGTVGQRSKFFIVSLESDPIRSIADLKDKIVGTTAAGSATSVNLEAVLVKAGMKMSDIQTQVVGASPNVVEFIKQKRISCFVTAIDNVMRLQKMGEPIVALSLADYIKMPGDILVTTRDVISGKPDLVMRFMRAMGDSVKEVIDGDLIAILKRESGDFEMVGLEDIKAAAEMQEESMRKLWLSEGRQNLLKNVPELWAAGADALRSLGYKNIAAPETYYTNAFVPAV